MTKLKRMDIAVANPQMVYFPGQVIQGQLIVELTATMKMRGIRLKCRGKGHVHWTEGSGDNKRSYSASEDYIDITLVVFGSGPSGGNEVSLCEGIHNFPFQFVLPVTLPGSFEGRSSCYVRYWLKGTIDKPWKFDPEVKSLFTVGSFLDLNTIPTAMSPAQSTDSKTVCCCCCESGPITATFRIDRMGYVPGESIVCNAEIDDKTGRGVHSSKMRLVMKTTYSTHGGSTDKSYQECGKLLHGAISPGGTDVWSGERLLIPPVPPSYLKGCNIIDIEYQVILTVDVVDTPFDLELPLTVIIGSIPLQSIVQQYMPQAAPDAVTNQPLGFGAPVGFNLPPPSYAECVFGKVDTRDDDDRHASGNMQYAPAYTYYDWLNPTGPPGGAVPIAPPGGAAPFAPPGGAAPYPPPGGAAPFAPPGGAAPSAPQGGAPPFAPPPSNYA